MSDPTDKEGDVVEIDTLLITPFKSKSLMDFYRSRENETVWQSEKNRQIILETIKRCEIEGLNPSDYNISKLVNLEKSFNDLDEDEQVNYDLLLTYNFEKYLTHLHSGKLNPRKLYGNWDLPIDELDTKSILNDALEKDSLICITEKCQPKALTYIKLIKALELINELPEDKTRPIDTTTVIRHSHVNREIINIKKKLLYWKDLDSKDSIVSYYDDETFEAVKKFQVRHGLTPDGVIGKSTIKALNFTKEERKRQIIVNLERWRWFAKSFARNYVLINIPNYSLNVVEDQSVTMTKRIVVGKNKRRTPVLTSVLQTVVFNPTWTVPPTILKEDMIPGLIKDRNFLKNKGIGIYDSDSNEVDPKKWDENRPRGYRYVQKPGYNNALGVVKINFPNRYSVYMHDTDHRDLFERNFRSLSSGCVRIEEPLELVELLLDNPKKFSREKMDSIIATQKTLFIGITKRYAVYQWYWTAWSENNELIFRDDIYNLDVDLYTQLRN
ncbi:L,D-transpeptidase family protein [Flavobacterium granuli]|uniref:Murein L,D-transpeptidase YcbB/YkuD n=1 Tax=Flavobacterium granuli TaxID=280093 RepID=A0ABU1RZ75_9FLAO|nr:L,D-transpeptidase family protein [Flavobacterium granuli]MDR6844059.1 murein L,D-transpeptidase YcbB/YkuD [Flavobacterium granuli]